LLGRTSCSADIKFVANKLYLLTYKQFLYSSCIQNFLDHIVPIVYHYHNDSEYKISVTPPNMLVFSSTINYQNRRFTHILNWSISNTISRTDVM